MRSAYAELLAGAQQDRGAFVRAEAGIHPWQHVGAFAFAEETSQAGWDAGVGIKGTWNW